VAAGTGAALDTVVHPSRLAPASPYRLAHNSPVSGTIDPHWIRNQPRLIRCCYPRAALANDRFQPAAGATGFRRTSLASCSAEPIPARYRITEQRAQL
jgi:hypothetical protein